MITISHLTEENRANLLKLATYLETLPDDHKEFDMSHFVNWREDPAETLDTLEVFQARKAAYVTGERPLHECGTAACALGHGPAAGVPAKERRGLIWDGKFHVVSWTDYSEAFVGSQKHKNYDSVWEFLFSSLWEAHDTQPRGAAGRIRYLLGGNPIPRDIDDENAFNIELYEDYVISKRN